MKTIKLAFALIIASLAMTACVEDKVYEGPNTIEAVSIAPDAPTSFEDVVVTAKVSGLLKVTKAVMSYSVDGDFVDEIEMAGDGKIFTATIPAQEDGTKVNYTVTITNEAGFTSTVEKDYTVGDKPSDFTKLVINEVCGAGGDSDKYLELYNNGDDPIKLKEVVIKKDEADVVWTGEDGEVIMGHGYFVIAGAKNALGEGGSGPNPRPMSKGLSAKKNVLMEVYDPSGNLVTKFQRGDAGEEGWGNGSSYNGLPYTENKLTWSRCPDGTGLFMIAPGSKGTKNPDVGEADLTVVQ